MLAVAVDQLRAHGNRCTVEHITRAAGTAKGNFYRYFRSWDDFLDSVRVEVETEYARSAGGLGDASSWERVEAEVRRYIDHRLDLDHVHDLLNHRPAASVGTGGIPALFAGLVAMGRADGSFGVVDAQAAGPLIYHLVHGAADQIAEQGDRERLETAALRLLRGALATDGR